MRGSGGDRGAVTQPALLPADPQPVREVVRCEDCRQPLTSAAARALRRGSTCLGEHYAARRGRIEQEALPGL
jgi:hypothetical protein